MLFDRILRTTPYDHVARLFASLQDASILLTGGESLPRELADRLRRIRDDVAVLLVCAGRIPRDVASQQTAEAVLLERLLAIGLERGGPEELSDLVRLAGDLAPCLLAAEARG